MTKNEIILSAVKTVGLIKADYVPNPLTRYKPGGSTGNMAFNSLRTKIHHDEIDIYIDSKIAPYVYFTNEPWISARWHGKKNPNEGWWNNRFFPKFYEVFKNSIGGL